MLYWYSDSITSSFYLYYNLRLVVGGEKHDPVGKTAQPVSVATGLWENHWPPRSTAERHLSTLRTYRSLPTGHFPQLEQPQLLADDMDEHFSSQEVQRALGRGSKL